MKTLKEFIEFHLLTVTGHEKQAVDVVAKMEDVVYQRVFVDDRALVHYLPVNGKKLRASSLTRYIRYVQHQGLLKDENGEVYYGMTGLHLQRMQDALIKWALENITGASEKYKFEIVEGEELWLAYKNGPHSCMKGRKAQSMLYWSNPDKVKLLKIYDEGKYAGRALIWYTDDGEVVLDRIYPGNSTLAYATRAYAKQQGWNHKSWDGVGGDLAENKAYTITLKHVTNKRLPYLDTFCYLAGSDSDGLKLTNSSRGSNDEHPVIFLPSVGDYSTTSSVYARGTLLDRKSIARHTQIVKEPWMNAPELKLYDPAYLADYVYYAWGSYAFYLKPGETLYQTTHVGRLAFRRTFKPLFKAIVEINGEYYRRKDVRKVRNQNTFTVKPDAKPIPVRSIEKLDKGAKVVTFELGAEV